MRRFRYSPSWFRSFRESASQSAEVVVPILMRLAEPTSVVDMGCGLGAWLNQFRIRGVDDVLGIDGEYVSRPDLLIEQTQFRPHDLRQPLQVDRRFDLCLCLEVAEHLPAASADALVDSLTQLAPIVCFSAAIPNQGGTHHINEQWPDYWVDRFAQRGYRYIDGLRRHLWNDSRVDYWYAQNAVLFATDEAISQHASLRDEFQRTPSTAMAMVHPHLFQRTALSLERTWDYRIRRSLSSMWRWAKTAG